MRRYWKPASTLDDSWKYRDTNGDGDTFAESFPYPKPDSDA
jgi:hypothetical protein